MTAFRAKRGFGRINPASPWEVREGEPREQQERHQRPVVSKEPGKPVEEQQGLREPALREPALPSAGLRELLQGERRVREAPRLDAEQRALLPAV